MSQQRKIFIFAPIDETGECHRQLEAAGCDLVLGAASLHGSEVNTEGEMCELAHNAFAMMGTSVRSSPITRRIMEEAGSELRIVAKFTVGVDDVDVDAATELGVMVTHAPTESNWGGVAEGTMAMMLALLKKVRERDEAMKAGGWRDPGLQGTYLGRRVSDDYPGITVGIIGLGRIGRRLADLLAPWRVRLLACDPYVEPSRFILHNCQSVDLPTLLKESDVVTLHMVSMNHGSGLYPGMMWAMRSVLKVLKGEVPDNVFNTEVIPRWRERFGGKPLA